MEFVLMKVRFLCFNRKSHTFDFLEQITYWLMSFRLIIPEFVSEVKADTASQANDILIDLSNEEKIAMENFLKEFILFFLDFGLKIRLKFLKYTDRIGSPSNLL